MRYSAVLVLATAIISRVAAGPVGRTPAVHQRHGQFHEKKDVALNVDELERRDITTTVRVTSTVYEEYGKPTPAPAVPTPAAAAAAAASPPPAAPAAPAAAEEKPKAAAGTLTDADASKLSGLNILKGKNSQSSSDGGAWIGGDGPYTNTFTNNAGSDIILVLWGKDGSWVNVKQPYITSSLPKGSSITVSFASGTSGAFTALYPNTVMNGFGMIKETWGEFTMSPAGVADVSREVFAYGNSMSIKGPVCTSDMDTCVFKCPDGQESCEFGYKLHNCSGFAGANAGYDAVMGGDSGGCGWNNAATADLKTTFS